MHVADGLDSIAPVAVNLFILGFLLLAVCISLPRDYVLKRLDNPVGGMIRYASFFCQWTMFTSRLPFLTRRLKATIHLAGADTAEWHPVYLHELSRFRAFFYVRQHSYSYRVLGEQGDYLKGALCQYLAKQFTIKGQPPMKIELIELGRPTAAQDDSRGDPMEFEHHVIYIWTAP